MSENNSNNNRDLLKLGALLVGILVLYFAVSEVLKYKECVRMYGSKVCAQAY